MVFIGGNKGGGMKTVLLGNITYKNNDTTNNQRTQSRYKRDIQSLKSLQQSKCRKEQYRKFTSPGLEIEYCIKYNKIEEKCHKRKKIEERKGVYQWKYWC